MKRLNDLYVSVVLVLLLALTPACKESRDEGANPTFPVYVAPADNCPIDATQGAVIQDINRLAVPFEEVSLADNSMPALSALSNVFSTAQVVGLGESTHGTKEFSQLKHYLFKEMATKHGYKILAAEITWGEALYLNDYIVGGKGDLKTMLQNTAFWMWQTQEVMDLLEWMKAYNQGKAEEDKVYFYGLDMQHNFFHFPLLENYIQKVDPDWLPAMTELYKPYKEIGFDYGSTDETFKTDTRQRLQQVYNTILARQAAYISKSSQREYLEALQMVRVILQSEDFRKDPTLTFEKAYAKRDLYMAQNVAWLNTTFGNKSKIAIWAHNGHIGSYAKAKSLGWNLKNELGESYQAIGLAFSRGQFNAYEQLVEDQLSEDENAVGDMKAHTIEAPLCGTTNSVFHKTRYKNFIIRLKEIPQGTALHNWITTEKPWFEAGAIYSSTYAQQYYLNYALRENFDMLLYLQETTQAELL